MTNWPNTDTKTLKRWLANMSSSSIPFWVETCKLIRREIKRRAKMTKDDIGV